MARGLALCAWLLLAANSPAEIFLLRGATVHTVSGETLSPGSVLVRDGKIAAVGRTLEAGGANVIELAGRHLYPGLIAASSSLGLIEIEAVRATRDLTEVGDYTPDVQAWIAVNPDSELLPVARANGITHALVVPAGGIVSGHSGLIALDGWTSEQMTVRSPVALHVFWPGQELDATPKEQFRDKSKWKSLEDQARDRRKKLKELEEFFDEAGAYAKARQTGKPGATVPAWEAMLPFLESKIPVMVHADEVRQIKAAVAWATNRHHRMILAGGRDAALVAGLLATNQIPVIFDQVFQRPSRDHESYDIHFKTPALLHAAGVRVVFSEGLGADQATRVRNLPYAAAQAVAFGFPAEEALRGLTLYPAQLLGVADRLGSIETGKEATMFVADGDILDLRSTVQRLWIAGKEVSLASRHTRLYEKYRARPKGN